MTTSVLRAFRAPEYRDLARMALDQGWDVTHLRGRHVRATNPTTGARVDLSATAYTTHGNLAAKRREFAQAGLDLESRRRHRQEASMAMTEPTPTPERARPPIIVDPPRSTPAGGKYARTSVEELTIQGATVQVSHRADGVFQAYTRDLGYKSHRRAWQGRDRDALVARITTDLAESPPLLDLDAATDERLDAAVGAITDKPARPNGRGDWHVVQVSAGDYPLAEALDRLDMAMAPALEALEAAGKTDAAGLLRGELDRSPMEAELLALYRRVARSE